MVGKAFSYQSSLATAKYLDYAITLDATGKELKREALKTAGGNNLARMSPVAFGGDARPALAVADRVSAGEAGAAATRILR